MVVFTALFLVLIVITFIGKWEELKSMDEAEKEKMHRQKEAEKAAKREEAEKAYESLLMRH